MKVFETRLKLPDLPPQPNDIAKQVLTVSVDGVTGDPKDILLTDTVVEVGTFKEGQKVSVSLHYVDDVGNVGPDQVESTVIHDSTPPGEPGKLSFVLTETFVPDEPAK